MTADDKYSLCKKGILQQPIQMDLCQKQNIFSQLRPSAVKLTFNFQHLEKKSEHHGAYFPKLQTANNAVT